MIDAFVRSDMDGMRDEDNRAELTREIIRGWFGPLFLAKQEGRGVIFMLMRLIKDEQGQTMVEYGLLVALISIAVIGVLILLGPRIAGFFTSVDNQLAAVPLPGAGPVVP